MELKSYTAQELWDWAFGSVPKFLLLDVRNDKDFARSKVEAPGLWVQNLSYIDFIEEEAESLGKVAAQKDQPVRIVCAKDGSARYVAEVLVKAGFSNVASLAGGITTWGDLLVHKLVHLDQEFELYQFQRPGKGSLSYALVGHAQMWVFDPARVLEPYLTLAKSKGVVITNLFETHLQADYVSGGKALAAATGAKLWGHPGDFAGADYKIGPVTDHQNWARPACHRRASRSPPAAPRRECRSGPAADRRCAADPLPGQARPGRDVGALGQRRVCDLGDKNQSLARFSNPFARPFLRLDGTESPRAVCPKFGRGQSPQP